MAHSMLLRIATFQGDYKRAAAEQESVSKHLNRRQTPDCGSQCEIAVSSFYVPLGRCDKVAGWLLEDTDRAKSLAPISLHRGQWVRARCLLHKGRYTELLGYLSQLDAQYEVMRSLPGLIENACMRAIAYYYSGEHGAAYKALHDSYLLSYENGIIMLHIEFGKWMRTLVRAAKTEKSCTIPDEWLDMRATKASSYAKRLAVMTKAYEMASEGDKKQQVNLSRRETDLLTGLCQGLTREELAQAYGLSVNTVKSMLPIIFEKLGAANSLDAVRIAATLDLIS
jgi:LuxR family maltose regulon positive regulatory protein